VKSLALVLLIMLVPFTAYAQGAVGWEQHIAKLDTSELENLVASFDSEVQKELPRFDLKQLVANPGSVLDVRNLFGRLGRYLTNEIILNVRLLGQLILLAVFCAILRGVASAFSVNGAADAAFLVAFLALLLLALQSFRIVTTVAVEAIDAMVSFMQAILPLMITMLAAVGGIATASVFHPLLFMIVYSVATVIKGVIIPLVFLSAILGVLGVVAKDMPMKQLSSLTRQWSVTIIGLLFIVFFAVLTMRGAIAPVTDGLTLKTAKFLTGTFVPVVGSRLADALDVVVGSSLLMKNAIGVFGMASVFLITIFPAVKVFAILTIYRVTTALIEPVSDERLVSVLGSLASSLTLVLASLLTVGLMFFICITVLIGLSNVPAYMR
jgi:stage III sporulation protein AE